MSRKFLVNLDLNKNELQNARIQNLGTAPSTPVEGQIYYDTATKSDYVWNGTAWRPRDAAKLTDGSIANTALTTNPLNRANHTGTQLASTVSDFDTQVRLSRLDQMAAPTAAVGLNSQKITGLGTPTADTDAATKKYVDDNIAGLSWKDEVRVATTVAGTLASSFANGQTVDGIALATSDRILIKNQAAGAENGIYVVNASGAPTRAIDSDIASEVLGLAVYVANGTVNGGQRYVNSNTGAITLGTTALTFATFGGGAAYTAGNGLTLTTNDFNVGAGVGINVTADAVNIDVAVVARKYTATVGNGALTAIPVNHALANQFVLVGVYEVATGAEVECDVVLTDANNVTLTFAVAPLASAIRVVVFG